MRRPWTNTRPSQCHRTARARAADSASRPMAARSSGDWLWSRDGRGGSGPDRGRVARRPAVPGRRPGRPRRALLGHVRQAGPRRAVPPRVVDSSGSGVAPAVLTGREPPASGRRTRYPAPETVSTTCGTACRFRSSACRMSPGWKVMPTKVTGTSRAPVAFSFPGVRGRSRSSPLSRWHETVRTGRRRRGGRRTDGPAGPRRAGRRRTGRTGRRVRTGRGVRAPGLPFAGGCLARAGPAVRRERARARRPARG